MRYTRKMLEQYQMLCEEWIRTEEALRDLTTSVNADALGGKPVDSQCRDELAELAAKARQLLIAATRVAPPTRRS